MFPDKIYYEPDVLNYPLGQELKAKYASVPWIEIESHNKIDELRSNENSQFANMKRHIIIGTRKTHKYVPNHKVSDYLVPYTSSGCSAMCLYCYLVCNYNKCSYLRLFVNREKMMERLIKSASSSDQELTFEIGSNSDLVLENTITSNLEWTIPAFTAQPRGYLTFPTKFDMVDPLLNLPHKGRVIFRMSLNPQEIISKIEIGTSSLKRRVQALNKMCDAGYKVGILFAPIILVDDWKKIYAEFFTQLADTLSDKVKKEAFIEIIFMTYSFVHRAINAEAFPSSPDLYNKENMTGRGRGKYCYQTSLRTEGESFLREQIADTLGDMPILYVV